jgi:hypothetical protein
MKGIAMSPRVVLITGASSGFGAMTAHALADAEHIVYAEERRVALRPVEMDVSDEKSVEAAVAVVFGEHGRIDVLIHNAGHMVLGPAEAFTPEQVASVYDTNVLSTQQVNRAVLPHMRARHDGLVVWLGSSSSRGGTPSYLGPYFAANAAHPADIHIANEYEAHYAGLTDEVSKKLAEMAPADADPSEVARQIVKVVDMPPGSHPFLVYIDSADDGAEDVFRVGDRVRQWFYQRIGMSDLLSVSSPAPPIETADRDDLHDHEFRPCPARRALTA